MSGQANTCLICGLMNHASVDEYKKLFVEVMMNEPNKKWSEKELFDKVSSIARMRKHRELGLIN